MTGFFAALVFALSLGLPLWLSSKVGLLAKERRTGVVLLVIGALALGTVVHGVERWATAWLAESTTRRALDAAVFLVLLTAPLGEAAKVVCVWPFYRARRLFRHPLGASYAVVVAGGYAASNLALGLLAGTSTPGLGFLRALVALPAEYFFAGLWGHMLGGVKRDRHFGWVFLVSVFLHGLYDHLVFSRGPAFLVLAVPMLVMMSLGVFGLARQAPTSSRPSTFALFEPSGAESFRTVMTSDGRPIQVRWILLGALVTLGVVLALGGTAIYFGLRSGIDFSALEDAGASGIAPLALLGGAFLLAFPTSAFLVAVASGTTSVLEPAWATLLAIGLAVALFSLTDSSALLVVLAIAPVGFALACAGAWFGLSRR